MRFTRRSFLKFGFLSAASVALAGCGRPVEHGLVSQYSMPEYSLPGQPLYWASSCPVLRSDCSVSVKTVQGRAIHVLGMPGHPFNKGKVGMDALCGPQSLYHPDRLDGPTQGGSRVAWSDVVGGLAKQVSQGPAARPLFIVNRLYGSLGGLILELASRAGAKILVLDRNNSVQERQVIKALTGKAELPYYPLEETDYLVTFGSDFINHGYSPVRAGWAYGQFRRGQRRRGVMVSVASRLGATEACADRWLPVRPGTEGWVALAVGNILAGQGKGPWPDWARKITLEQVARVTDLDADLIRRLAARLGAAHKPLVVAGGAFSSLGAESLFAGHAINRMLRGAIPTFEPDLVLQAGDKPVDTKGMFVSTEDALKLMSSGDCRYVWMFDVNPAYTLPGGVKFADALSKVPDTVAFGCFSNDTFAHCKTLVPTRHWMEDWGDLRMRAPGLDLYNVQQPVVSPHLAQVRSVADVLLAVAAASKGGALAYANARELIKRDLKGAAWETLLIRGGVWPAQPDGVYPNPVGSPPPAAPNTGKAPAAYSPFEGLEPLQVASWPAAPTTSSGFTFVPFMGSMGDGATSNLPWMQELPDTMTTVVWDSWIEINEQVAKKHGIKRHDLLRITVGDKSFLASAFPSPGVHPEVVAMPMGRGHENFGCYGPPVGVGVAQANFGRDGGPGHNPIASLPADFQSGEPVHLAPGVTFTNTGRVKRLSAYDSRAMNMRRQVLPE